MYGGTMAATRVCAGGKAMARLGAGRPERQDTWAGNRRASISDPVAAGRKMPWFLGWRVGWRDEYGGPNGRRRSQRGCIMPG
jgi:hypothetical protein